MSAKPKPASVLISYHSDSQEAADLIQAKLAKHGLDTFLISEKEPGKLNDRARLVQICDAFLVLSNGQYQKTVTLMELLNYAKDLKKKIYAINLKKSYCPFGALGAIVASAIGGLYQYENDGSVDTLAEALLKLSKPSGQPKFSDFISTRDEQSSLVFDGDEHAVIISYHPETEANAKLIQEALQAKGVDSGLEDSTRGVSIVSQSKVVILLMSPGYEASNFCRLVIEEARDMDKDIIPISTSKAFQPQAWLGLVIGGKLYYRIFTREQAYEKFYDSSMMNNLVYGVETALTDRPSVEELEQAQEESLKKRIEECKAKLTTWPPKHNVVAPIERPVKKLFVEPHGDPNLPLFHEHYEVTRMDFNPPKPMFDKFGAPIRHKFDCMISYQWDYQELVRGVYMQLHMKSVSIWFDIWGGMEGNSNEAMATAIECSKVILVFLSDKYQKSVNCQLEFNYAVARGKPFVFIMVEPGLKVEPWLEPYYNTPEYPKYEIRNKDDEAILHNNIPRIDIIARAVRDIGQVQPDDDVSDLSEELFNLKQLLNDCLDEIAQNSGQARFKKCTRCKIDYDENSQSRCKKHSAYYLGGSLIAGRWVCCQQDDTSIGCKDADHIDVERVWQLDSNYGTYTYVPA